MTDPTSRRDRSDEGPAPRPGLLDRLRAGTASTGSRPPARGGTTKWQIDRLDARERRLSYAAAIAATALGVIVYLVESSNKHFRLSKGELTPQTTLILGLVFGALLAVATLIGRRAPVGFVALFCFLAFGTLMGAPFLVLAGWLLYRSYKFQKEASARLKEANAERPPSNAPRARGSAPARGSPAARGSAAAKARQTKARAKAPVGPEASKRFTPKRPAPPPPKPSRKSRKAAETAD